MAKAKVIGLKQLRQKRYDFLENLPQDFIDSFGQLVSNFSMTVWGHSSKDNIHGGVPESSYELRQGMLCRA
jgi:hypothetical protein